ncbi:Replication protein A 32 kDa subunit-A [Galdieria sulphuraria]|nr:Replication protein A 32 kDa subunit-A [Galdieria sulphuraria]
MTTDLNRHNMNNSLFGANFNLGGTFQPFPQTGQSFASDPFTSPSKYAPALQTTVDRNQALQPVSLNQLVHATQEHPDDAFQKTELRPWKREALQPGVWVRVFGSLREFNGERSVKAHHIQPIEDMNEILFHRLQVIQVYLQQTHGPTSKSKQTMNSSIGSGIQSEHFDHFTDNMNDSSFSPIQQSVLLTIRQISKDYRGYS